MMDGRFTCLSVSHSQKPSISPSHSKTIPRAQHSGTIGFNNTYTESSLSMALFETIVQVVASCTACYMCLSPLPCIMRIRREKSTGHTPSLPLVMQWVYNNTWMLYGFVTRDYFPVFATYVVGNIASVSFLVVYWIYCPNRCRVAQLVAVAVLFNALLILYVVATSCTNWFVGEMESIVGVVGVACGLALFASPFATIRRVLQSRTAASIPIGMVSVGLVSNAVWLLYGFLVHDAILIIPTAVSTVFCLIQTVLYIAFHPSKSTGGMTTSIISSTDADSSESPISSPTAASFVICLTPIEKKPSMTMEVSLTGPGYEELRSPVPSVAIQV